MKSVKVNKSEDLEPVEISAFVKESHVWNGAHCVKDKVSGKIMLSNSFKISSGHGSLDKAK